MQCTFTLNRQGLFFLRDALDISEKGKSLNCIDDFPLLETNFPAMFGLLDGSNRLPSRNSTWQWKILSFFFSEHNL